MNIPTIETSIIIPCFNEEDGVRQTVEQLLVALEDQPDWELILVNDGSTDGTARVLDELVNEHPFLRVIHQPQNAGYGAALKTGIRVAGGEFIAITDADGTYPNDRLPELIARCRDCDMVVGARTGDDVTYSHVRRLPKYFLRHWMSWIARYDIPDINSGLRVFRRHVAQDYLGILPEGFSFTCTITLAMLTNHHPTQFIPINYRARIGSSKIKPIRDTAQFIGLILRTGIYFAPLRAFLPAVMVLLAMAITSTAYDVFALGNLTDKTVLLFLFTLNTGMFALLADMIDKRTRR